MAHTNAVNEIAKRAGISLGNNNAFRENAASVGQHMSQSAGNLEKINAIAQELNDQSSPSGPSAPQSGGSGFLRSALTAGALAGAAIAAPALAPVAAAVGAAMAVGDAVHFGLKSSVGMGEMTLASAVAKFNDNDEMTHYTSACDGVTTSVASGKAVGKTTIGPSAAVPARGMHNFSAIVGEVAGEFDAEQIQKDLLAAAKNNSNSIALDQRRLMTMGVGKNDASISDMDNYVGSMNADIRSTMKAPAFKVPAFGMA